MARVCGNGGIGHAEKASNDSGDFKAVEALRLHLRQNSLYCILDSARSKSAKKPHLDFRCHEKEVPTCRMDFAVEGETVQSADYAPFSRAGIALQSKEFRDQRPLFDQNGSDVYG